MNYQIEQLLKTDWLQVRSIYAENISKITIPTDVNAKMILFNSDLKVFMVQPLKLENLFQDYICETIINFLAVHMNGFYVLQKTNPEM